MVTSMNMGMDTNHSGHGGVDHVNTHTMQMTFYVGNHVTVLLDGWTTKSRWELFGTCVALIIIGILYEALKTLRQVLLRKSGNVGGAVLKFKLQANKRRFAHALLHMLQITIGYLLMLAFMTYNVWICISIILGAGLGYFLFAVDQQSMESVSNVVQNDHCNL